MRQLTLRYKSYRVVRFIIVNFIALLGWVLVQTFFSLTAVGHMFSFTAVVLIEAIWWMALLLVMLVLFLQEYNRYVEAAVELEDANRRLREAANQLLNQTRSEPAG